MTVRVKTGSGSGRGTTQYQDVLSGTDQPFMVGDFWAPTQNALNPPVGNAYAGADVAAGINRGATGLSYKNNGAGGFTPVLEAFPILIDWSACFFLSQFSEFVPVSTTAGINRVGISCFQNPNGAQNYNLEWITEAGQFGVNRWNGAAQTGLIAPSATTAFSLLDTLRLSVDIATTPGTTIVRAYKNGVLIATFNDNSVSRLTQGTFGLHFGGSNPAVTAVVRNWAGGIL